MNILGTYRNSLGVELEVAAIHYGLITIGTVYEGAIRDSLFGYRHVLVTEQGLTECGYVKIDAPEPTP